MRLLKPVFWTCAGLVVYAQAGYAGLLWLVARRRPGPPVAVGPAADGALPSVSVIVAAYREQDVIARRVENLRALDYPAERLEIVVACDGSPDATAQRARDAGADVVLELPRGGKVRAQDAAVRASRGNVVAFTDANARWEADALRALVAPLADPRVGYVCGRLSLLDAAGDNQEGAYWRFELAQRAWESAVWSVTAGNGAIYALRREAYVVVDPIMGHDLSLPFNLVKRGWRAVYAPAARATEKPVPTIEGEFARKRRMMSHTWPIVVRGGLLSARGYPPRYAWMLYSHRALRYATPFLHAAALPSSLVLAAVDRGPLYRLAVAEELGVLAGAAAAPRLAVRPLLLARYYVLTTASIAAGLWDWLRRGTEAGWEPAEGTR